MDNIIVDENTLVTLNPLPYPATPIPKKTLPSFNPSTTVLQARTPASLLKMGSSILKPFFV